MLQQILSDMFIDPELLAELDEEQKQVLFCKMREEQVRRWREREEKMEADEKKNPPKRSNGRKGGVRWLLGADEQPWTWVMGEHAEDRSVDDILEDEAKQRAERLAEQEAMEKQQQEEEEAQRRLAEEEKRLADETMRKEEEIRKKSSEAELYQSLKVAKALQRRLEEEKCKEEEVQKKKIKEMKRQHEQWRRSSLVEIEQHKAKRSSELFDSYKLERRRIVQIAEQQSVERDIEWKEQESRVRRVHEERRQTARRAREEHRRSLQDTVRLQSQMIGIAMASLRRAQAANAEKENTPPRDTGNSRKTDKIRPNKPSSRAAIVDWFKELERSRGSGLDPKTDQVAAWFHGIITRNQAEELLKDSPVGGFLVRVSERIWGYAISYKGPTRCQHFLIDTADGNYQFFGTNQIRHASLADLIQFHNMRPVTSLGDELLKHPVGQPKHPPDYKDLFEDCATETSYL